MDNEFQFNEVGLHRAVQCLGEDFAVATRRKLPASLPDAGIGAAATLELLAPIVLGDACTLDAPSSFAHMDPPTPWVSWATALWNASLNQNLLHPATAPAARDLEARVIAWLAPCFGMSGGHMTPGSTLSNLTALWAARECAGIEEVVASEAAHVSIAKAAHILALRYRTVACDRVGRIEVAAIPQDLSRTVLVLTAGTTSTGAIDSLELVGRAAWTHVDAAWGGPLRLTCHQGRLAGLDSADSVAVSAHKWLFQPKESALILFRDTARAHAAISFGGPYLAAPNVGVLGSHGATAVPLLATLLAWGKAGLAAQIERCMDHAEALARFVQDEPRLVLFAPPETGIVVWRPRDTTVFDPLHRALPSGAVSTTRLSGERWFRNVAANPNADVRVLIDEIARILRSQGPVTSST